MQRVAKEHPAELEQQDRQRRLIDVAEGEVPAARYIIELIPEVTVTAIGEQVDEQGCQAEGDQQGALRCRPSRRGFGTGGLHSQSVEAAVPAANRSPIERL